MFKFGVPQGSVLGPVPFVPYATLVTDIMEKHPVQHEGFAHDIHLQLSGGGGGGGNDTNINND